jgi:pimeloyl-ACP methyl ester carboxylesterase
LDELARDHTVYAVDLLGFGRSSRHPFSGQTPEDAEKYFVDSFETWRKTLGLDKFHLLGHSMGAYLSAVYTLQEPSRVSRLILADPWGLPERPADWDDRIPAKWKAIIKVVSSISNSPLSLLRAAGPIGPSLIQRVRPDLVNKFGRFFPDEDRTALDYIYHVNAQAPAGEEAFAKLTVPIGFAAKPLVNRLHEISEDVPVSFIYGEDTWMDIRVGVKAKESMKSPTDFVVIPNAGHHVYIDNYDLFNEAVKLATKGKMATLSEKLRGVLESALQPGRGQRR